MGGSRAGQQHAWIGPVRPHARGETMTTQFEDIIRQNSQRLADLKKTTEELQRELSEARVSLERELARPAHGHDDLDYSPESMPYYSPDEPPFVGEGPRYDRLDRARESRTPDDRFAGPFTQDRGFDPTVGIVNHGRQSAYRRGLSRRSIIAISGAAAVLVTVLAVI